MSLPRTERKGGDTALRSGCHAVLFGVQTRSSAAGVDVLADNYKVAAAEALELALERGKSWLDSGNSAVSDMDLAMSASLFRRKQRGYQTYIQAAGHSCWRWHAGSWGEVV